MVGVYLNKPQDSWVLSVDNYRGGVFDVWLRWATNVIYTIAAYVSSTCIYVRVWVALARRPVVSQESL